VRVADKPPGTPQCRCSGLNECWALLTGQSLPILIVSGKVSFQVPIMHYLRQDDAMLCKLELQLVGRNISTPWIPAIPRSLRARPGYSQGSGFQHLSICASVTTGVAPSEDKKSG
jgi:hypothetical protein